MAANRKLWNEYKATWTALVEANNNCAADLEAKRREYEAARERLARHLAPMVQTGTGQTASVAYAAASYPKTCAAGFAK